MDASKIPAIIRQELKRRGMTAYRAALTAGLPENAIRYVLEGREPKAGRLAEICAALDLEFYVGPHRNPAENASRQVNKELEKAIQRTEKFLDQLKEAKTADDLTDPEALAHPVVLEGHDLSHPTLCSLGFHALPWRRQVRVSAGGGAFVEDGTVQGHLAFRDEWLRKKGVSPEKASVIEVLGDSMEPTLEDGSSILVDHQRNQLQHDRVFAVHTEDGLLVKRAVKKGNNWQLVSDNTHYKPLPWPREATIIGQVMWTGRTLA